MRITGKVVFLSFEGGPVEVTLTDLLGRELKQSGPWVSEPGKETVLTLTLAEFARSAYFIRVSTSKEVSLFRILKD